MHVYRFAALSIFLIECLINVYILMQGEINLRRAVIALEEKSVGRKQFHITVHGKRVQQTSREIFFFDSLYE